MLPLLATAILATQAAPALSLEQVRSASTAFASIDPDNDDFSDLEFLEKEIGNSRIVMLGEASHGDGTSFLAKTRIVKFLHQRMGFDVLAWEAGLLECREMDRDFQLGKSPFYSGVKGLFSLWSHSEQVQPLMRYVASTQKMSNRLEMAGFDHQFSSTGTPKLFGLRFLETFDGVDPSILEARDRQFLRALPFDFPMGRRRLASDEFKTLATKFTRIHRAFRENRSAFYQKYGEDEVRFLDRCLRNAVDYMVFANQYFYGKRRGGPDNNYRDLRMAENLRLLTQERYRNRKVIVWAASFHTARKVSAIDGPADRNYAETKAMGEVFASFRIPGVYSVAFVCHSGRYGILSGSHEVEPPPEGSLEALANVLGSDYQFFDLAKLPPRFVARPLGLVPLMGAWSENFDAFVYYREVKPNTMVKLPKSS